MGRTIAVVFPDWEKKYGQYGEHHSFHLFESLVRRMSDISAVVEVEKIGIAMMAARGPSRYFGGDEQVALALFDVCASSGDLVGVGIADTRFAALASAHLSALRTTPCVIASDITAEFIAALPVRALIDIGNIDADMVDLLIRLGLRTCGDVAQLGEVALIDRFGITGHHVFQLVSGRDSHSFAVDRSPSDFSRVYESEVALASVQHVVASVRPMVEEVMDNISSHGQQCIRMYIQCDTEHGESVSRIWGETHGFTTAALLQRLAYQLDGWYAQDIHNAHEASCVDTTTETPTSGVVRVFMNPMECRQLLTTQAVLWGGHEENTERAVRAMSQVLAVSDTVRVTVPQWEGGRDITSAYSRVPLAMVDITSVHESTMRVGAISHHVTTWSGTLPRPWPAWIAPQPIDISLVDQYGRHVGVTGRHELTGIPTCCEVVGKKYEVVQVGGPWPIEERWWDPRRARRHVRAQLLVRNTHGATRVFLVVLENAAWKLIGRYD